VRLLEVERKKVGEVWINVKRVRKALEEGDTGSLAACVPESTLAYLTSQTAAGFVRNIDS
jgi:citrate lyase synthetase